MVINYFVGPSFLLVNALHIPIALQVPVATSLTLGFAWLFTAFVYRRLPDPANWLMG